MFTTIALFIVALILFGLVYALGRLHERVEWIKWWGYEVKNNWTTEVGQVFSRNPSMQQNKNPFSVRSLLLLDGKEYRDS